MTLGYEWDYAKDYFRVANNVLYIKKDMPEDVKERFLPQITAHRDVVAKRRAEFMFFSGDMFFTEIVYED
ncbi:MAG: hypothetical protein ACOYU3_05930 [Bacillota bacterium]